MRNLLTLILLTSFAFAQEPIRFRGAYIGQPLSDYVDCTAKKPVVIKQGYKTNGKKLCEGIRGVVTHITVKGFLDPKDQGEFLWFESQKLFKIQIRIPNDDWAKVRYDLTQKMGEPVSEVPQVFQNGFGARWEYDQGFWVKDNIVAYAGIKVLAGVEKAFGPGPATEGIQITITDAEHAKLPETRPSTLD